ncbi:hypothetical protein GGC64_001326 [Mycobacterium sp. OAS707]|uniref:hypothetical protein n=1 Tax=unclassified Mycobacterium TaxID=2642494 RepID=UPI00178B8973|nr:hypothetical protein [Mycobacterium sp. OAS707]MBE1547318.1 hypothetical protein [Mycobacterium sp. OAS707]
MSLALKVDELQRLIDDLRGSVTGLAATYGDCRATRRILNGIHRLEIDVEELEATRGLARPVASRQLIQIPDTQYDHDFWRDVDHEGIGGLRA